NAGKVKDTKQAGIHVNVVALDPSLGEGEKGYTLMYLISSKASKDTPEYFAPTIVAQQRSEPFQELRGLELLAGRKKNTGILATILSISPSAPNPLKGEASGVAVTKGSMQFKLKPKEGS